MPPKKKAEEMPPKKKEEMPPKKKAAAMKDNIPSNSAAPLTLTVALDNVEKTGGVGAEGGGLMSTSLPTTAPHLPAPPVIVGDDVHGAAHPGLPLFPGLPLNELPPFLHAILQNHRQPDQQFMESLSPNWLSVDRKGTSNCVILQLLLALINYLPIVS